MQSHQNPAGFSVESDRLILKFIQNYKRPPPKDSKQFWKKGVKLEDYTFQLQNFLQSSSYKTMCWWQKDRHTEFYQWNRINWESKNKLVCQWSTDFQQWGTKTINEGRMMLGQLDSHIQKNETGPLVKPSTKINSKWI